MNANFKLKKDEAVYVEELLKIIMENRKEELSVKENMISFYLKRFPDTLRVDAEESVNKIIKGVSTFTQLYEEAKNAEELWIVNKIDEVTKDLSKEQKYECMLNLLLALKAVDMDFLSQKVSVEEFNAQKRFEELKNATISIAEGSISDEQLNEIVEMTKVAVQNSGISIVGNSEIIELIRELPENKDAALNFVEISWSEADYKNYASIATYIAYLEGAISSIPVNTDPEIIAVGVTVGIERDKLIEQATLGQITWEIACNAFKIIGGVASICLLIWMCIKILTISILLGGGILNILLGGSLLGFAAGVAIGGYIGYKASEVLIEFGSDAIIALGDGYDRACEFIAEGYGRVNDYFKETIIPTIQEHLRTLWEFIDEKILQGLLKIKISKIDPKTTVTVNDN